MKYVKYHALGNDYIVMRPTDLNGNPDRRYVQLICHRNYGVGSDGILLGPFESSTCDFRLRIAGIKVTKVAPRDLSPPTAGLYGLTEIQQLSYLRIDDRHSSPLHRTGILAFPQNNDLEVSPDG